MRLWSTMPDVASATYFTTRRLASPRWSAIGMFTDAFTRNGRWVFTSNAAVAAPSAERARRRLEHSAVHDRADVRDERVRVLVVRVPGHRDDDPRAGRREDDPGVVREPEEIAGLVRDDDAVGERGWKTVVDLLPLEPREHA